MRIWVVIASLLAKAAMAFGGPIRRDAKGNGTRCDGASLSHRASRHACRFFAGTASPGDSKNAEPLQFGFCQLSRPRSSAGGDARASCEGGGVMSHARRSPRHPSCSLAEPQLCLLLPAPPKPRFGEEKWARPILSLSFAVVSLA